MLHNKFSFIKNTTALFFLLLAACICLGLFTIAADSNIRVYVNGSLINYPATPINISDRLLVPLRATSNSLGLETDWIGQTQTAVIHNNTTSIRLCVNSDTAYINSKAADLEVAPILEAGNTLVPLRFVAEAINATVDWNGADKTVNITTTVNSLLNRSLAQKQEQVFGGDGTPYANKTQADNAMTTIECRVYKIDKNGGKYTTTQELTINKNIAGEVSAIFNDIYNSKFPIKYATGYSYRVKSTNANELSHHSYGTCIDINPEENYCPLAGVGSLWKPFENPYSIIPDGAVVAAFKNRGWDWGGEFDKRWIDYMHFTLLGE